MVTRWLLRRDVDRAGVPSIYVHPWELDAQPDDAIESGWLNRFIGNYGAAKTLSRLTELVARHPATTMKDRCAQLAVRERAQGT